MSKCLVGFLVPDDFVGAPGGGGAGLSPSSSRSAASLAPPGGSFKAPRLPGNSKAKAKTNVVSSGSADVGGSATTTIPDVTMTDADDGANAAVVGVPVLVPQKPAGPMKPNWDWYQSDKEVVL